MLLLSTDVRQRRIADVVDWMVVTLVVAVIINATTLVGSKVVDIRTVTVYKLSVLVVAITAGVLSLVLLSLLASCPCCCYRCGVVLRQTLCIGFAAPELWVRLFRFSAHPGRASEEEASVKPAHMDSRHPPRPAVAWARRLCAPRRGRIPCKQCWLRTPRRQHARI